MVLRFELSREWACECGRKHRIPLEEVLVERGATQRIPEVVRKLDAGIRCLVVEDRITREIAGKRVEKVLESSGYSVKSAIVTKADAVNVDRTYSRMKESDFCVGVGGGTPIDVAKAASHRRGIPLISFPTAPSHDGMVSPTASIMENGVKRSLKAHAPKAVVVDTKIISSAPRRMVAAGFADLMAKATSLKDWELGRDDHGEYYCNRSATLALSSFNDAVEYLSATQVENAVRILVHALINSGVSMIIAGSSRPCSGAEHLFSHYLDGHLSEPAMHGEQCGIGAVLLAKYHEDNNPNWWKEDQYNWQSIQKLLTEAGAPITLQQIGIEEEIAAEALVAAPGLRPERYTILHKKPLLLREAKKLILEIMR